MNSTNNLSWLSIALGLELTIFIFLVISLFLSWRRAIVNKRTRHLLEVNSSISSELDSENSLSQPAFTNQIAERFLKTTYGKWFERKCVRAGSWQSESVIKWAGRKIEISLSVALIAVAGFQLFNWSIYLLPVFAIAGFFLPDFLLIRKGDARSEEIVHNLPETIDLLNMTIEAGLGFQAGLERVSRMKSNPLSDEFRRVLTEIRLGDSRSRAFTSMAERINQKEVWGFTNAIAQVEKLGIPITNALRDQAIRMRAERKDKAREIAQKLPVKILAPIMLLLLPSVLIIVLGPAIYSIMQSL